MPSDSETITIILKQLDEQSQYVRINIQLLVQWFIFFATANYVTLGYFALKIADSKLVSARALYVVAALFLIVNCFAFVLCWHANKWFKTVAEIGRLMLNRLDELTNLPSYPVQRSSPLYLYSKVAGVMTITIVAMFSAWVFVVVAVAKAS